MRSKRLIVGLTGLLAGLIVAVTAAMVSAEGTETLGDPGIPIADGTGVVGAGTGLVVQPGTINITVPSGATVNQVLLYWEGQTTPDGTPDSTISIGGQTVVGTLIGGPVVYTTADRHVWVYRADITNLGLVSDGANSLTVSGLNFDLANDGAGVLVIYDDGSTTSDIGVFDGADFAFIDPSQRAFWAANFGAGFPGFEPPLDATVPQTFTFLPSATDRFADLTLFAGSVADDREPNGEAARPNVIEITTGGTTVKLVNELMSVDGKFWDTINTKVTIPAGATSVTVQLFSRDEDGPSLDRLPASMTWIGVGLSVPTPADPKIKIVKRTNGVDGDDPNGVIAEVRPGDKVKWIYTVTNKGNVPLEDVNVIDSELDKLGVKPTFIRGDTNNDGILQTDEVWKYRAFGVAADLDDPIFMQVESESCPSGFAYANMGTVTANWEGGSVASEDPDHACLVDPKIKIVKKTNGIDGDDPNGVIAQVRPGDKVKWVYTVTNKGNVPLEDVDVIDSELDKLGVKPTFIRGDANNDGILQPGEVWKYRAFGVAADLDDPLFVQVESGSCPSGFAYANMGTVTANWEGGSVASEDPDHACLVDPKIKIVKKTNGIDGNDPNGVIAEVRPGDIVKWVYTVTNGGNVPLEDVDVIDSELDKLGVKPTYINGDANNDGILQPGEIWKYRAFGVADDLDDPTFMQVESESCPSGFAYANMGTVTANWEGGTVSSEDPDHACLIIPELAGLGDFVWEDTNGNGTQDAGEPGINGITVSLHDPGANGACDVTDDLIASTTTANGGPSNTDGYYEFVDLDAGMYCVFFDTTREFTEQGVGLNEAIDSNADPATGLSNKVTLDPGEFDETIDAGILPAPDINIVKKTNGIDGNDPNGVIAQVMPGDTVTWTYEVTNPGDVALSDVDVVDDQLAPVKPTFTGGDTNNDGLLDTTETWTYEATGLADDLDYSVESESCPSGFAYANMGMVTANWGGGTVDDEDPDHACLVDPQIAIVKKTNDIDGNDPNGVIAQLLPGDTVTWTYEVTNPGNVPLDNVDVVDDQLAPVKPTFTGGDTNNDGLLDTTETWTYEATGLADDLDYSVESESCPSGFAYANMGSVTANWEGFPVDAEDPDHACLIVPEIDIVKKTNNIDGNDPDGVIAIVEPGETVIWDYLVTNPGDVPLSDVAVVDDQLALLTPPVTPTFIGGDTNNDGLLDTTETWVYRATGIAESLINPLFTQVESETCPSGFAYANLGSVTANWEGFPVNAEDPDHACVDLMAEIEIVKYTDGADANDPDGADVPQYVAGETVTWTYVVTNPGDVTLENVAVIDDQLDLIGVTPTFTGGDTNNDNKLQVTETWTYEATGPADTLNDSPFTQVASTRCAPDGDGGSGFVYANMGEVTAQWAGGPVMDDDPSHACLVSPEIDIVKVTNGIDGNDPDGVIATVEPGDPVTWTYTVTNTGNVELSDVSVVDDQLDLIGVTPTFTGGDTNNDGKLQVTETWTYQATGQAEDLVDPTFTQVDSASCPRGSAYQNTGTVTANWSGVPVDAADIDHACLSEDPDIDIEKFTKVVPPLGGQDVCVAPDGSSSKPTSLTFRLDDPNATAYVPFAEAQDSSKVEITGTVTQIPAPVTITDGKGSVQDSPVDLDGQFTLIGDATFNSETIITVGGQEIRFHTSCSQPLTIGDKFGALTLVGFTNEDGGSGTIPVDDPADIGENADNPMGPAAIVGDKIRWTYLVTNPGDVPLSNIVVTDDAGTASDSGDDFNPDPILSGGFNVGDVNQDGLLDVGEEWRYQAEGVAEFGQYRNDSDVEGTSPGGTTVTDEDPSHYNASFPSGDMCEQGKPISMTFRLISTTATAYIPNGPGQNDLTITGSVGSLPATVTEDDNDAIVVGSPVLNVGDTFSFVSIDGNKDINPETWIIGGQTIELHFSCSQPFNLGDVYGGIQLIEWIPKP